MGGIIDIECLDYLPAKFKAPNYVLKFHYDVQESIKKLPYPNLEGN